MQTKTITQTCKWWTQFVAANEPEAQYAEMVETVKAALADHRAELAKTYTDELNLNHFFLNSKLAISLAIPA